MAIGKDKLALIIAKMAPKGKEKETDDEEMGEGSEEKEYSSSLDQAIDELAQAIASRKVDEIKSALHTFCESIKEEDEKQDAGE